jgi:c-di-GMP-binding flagellar brake protein YcgR
MDKTADTNGANRRKSQRRKPRRTVKIECRKGSYGLGANLAVVVLDLSDTGVRLIASQELEAQAEVEIIISGYGMTKAIKRAAYVRWQVKLENGQFCLGVEFQKRLPYRDWQNLASPN